MKVSGYGHHAFGRHATSIGFSSKVSQYKEAGMSESGGVNSSS